MRLNGILLRFYLLTRHCHVVFHFAVPSGLVVGLTAPIAAGGGTGSAPVGSGGVSLPLGGGRNVQIGIAVDFIDTTAAEHARVGRHQRLYRAALADAVRTVAAGDGGNALAALDAVVTAFGRSALALAFAGAFRTQNPFLLQSIA